MHSYWIRCRCGHEGRAPAPLPFLSRAEVLRRARCSVCGARIAADMRIIFDLGVNPRQTSDPADGPGCGAE